MEVRLCRRVLSMVSELHLRGYQRLRIAPGLSGQGVWRCSVTNVTNVLHSNGALLREPTLAVHYSSDAGRHCFDWPDAGHLTAGRLAEVFIERFPDVCQPSYGADWLYAGWYLDMLHRTYPDALPIADTGTGPFRGLLGTCGGPHHELPPPPPGEAYLPHEIVQNWGGYLMRVLATLNGFRRKHGEWPTTLSVSQGVLDALQFHLTDVGMRLLESKLRLILRDGEAVLVAGGGSSTFDYQAEEGAWNEPDQRADEWLGFGRLV